MPGYTKIRHVWRGDVRHHWKTVNGSRIHWVEIGSPAGLPVLCVDGWMGSWEAFKGVMKYFDVRYRLIIVDIPGFGESEPLATSHTVAHVSKFLKAFTDSIGLRRFHLLGLSFGGAVAIHFSATYPSYVEKLVVQGAPFYGKLFKRWMRFGSRVLTFPCMIRFVGIVFRRERLVYRVLRSQKDFLFATDVDIQRKAKRTGRASPRAAMESARDATRLDLRNYARRVRAPTLIIDGADVKLRALAGWDLLRSLIPNSQLVLIRGAAHTVPGQKPTEFSKEVFFFLRQDKRP